MIKSLLLFMLTLSSVGEFEECRLTNMMEYSTYRGLKGDKYTYLINGFGEYLVINDNELYEVVSDNSLINVVSHNNEGFRVDFSEVCACGKCVVRLSKPYLPQLDDPSKIKREYTYDFLAHTEELLIMPSHKHTTEKFEILMEGLFERYDENMKGTTSIAIKGEVIRVEDKVYEQVESLSENTRLLKEILTGGYYMLGIDKYSNTNIQFGISECNSVYRDKAKYVCKPTNFKEYIKVR